MSRLGGCTKGNHFQLSTPVYKTHAFSFIAEVNSLYTQLSIDVNAVRTVNTTSAAKGTHAKPLYTCILYMYALQNYNLLINTLFGLNFFHSLVATAIVWK